MPQDPKKGEKKSEWIPKCISITIKEGKYPPKQAAAICFSRWKEYEKKHKKKSRSKGEEILIEAIDDILLREYIEKNIKD